MILTMPGATGWAITNSGTSNTTLPAVIMTSKPNSSNSGAPNSNNPAAYGSLTQATKNTSPSETPLATATALAQIAGQIGSLIAGNRGVGGMMTGFLGGGDVINGFASIVHPNVQTNDQPASFADTPITYVDAQGVTQKSTIGDFTDMQMNELAMNMGDYSRQLFLNDDMGNLLSGLQGQAELDAQIAGADEYLKSVSDNATNQSKYLADISNGLSKGGTATVGDTIDNLNELEGQLTTQITQQIYLANSLYVSLSSREYSLDWELNHVYGHRSGATPKTEGLNQIIDGLINSASDSQPGWVKLTAEIKKAQAIVDEAEKLPGEYNDGPGTVLGKAKANIAKWQRQLDTVNQKLCGGGRAAADAPWQGTFSMSPGSTQGSCGGYPKDMDANDPQHSGFIAIQKSLVDRETQVQQSLTQLKTNYLLPAQSKFSNEPVFAQALNQTWDPNPASRPTDPNKLPPLIKVSDALGQQESAIRDKTTKAFNEISTPKPPPPKTSFWETVKNNAKDDFNTIVADVKGINAARANSGGVIAASVVNNAQARQSQLSEIQQRGADYANLKVELGQTKDTAGKAEKSYARLQMKLYGSKTGSSSAWQHTLDILSVRTQVAVMSKELLDNAKAVSKFMSKLPTAGDTETKHVCVDGQCFDIQQLKPGALSTGMSLQSVAATLMCGAGKTCNIDSTTQLDGQFISYPKSPFYRSDEALAQWYASDICKYGDSGCSAQAILDPSSSYFVSPMRMAMDYAASMCDGVNNCSVYRNYQLVTNENNPYYIFPQNLPAAIKTLQMVDINGGYDDMSAYYYWNNFVGPLTPEEMELKAESGQDGWVPGQLNVLDGELKSQQAWQTQQNAQLHTAESNAYQANAAFEMMGDAVTAALKNSGAPFWWTPPMTQGIIPTIVTSALSAGVNWLPQDTASQVANGMLDATKWLLTIPTGTFDGMIGIAAQGFDSTDMSIRAAVSLSQNPTWSHLSNYNLKDFANVTYDSSSGLWLSPDKCALDPDVESALNARRASIIASGDSTLDPSNIHDVLNGMTIGALPQQWMTSYPDNSFVTAAAGAFQLLYKTGSTAAAMGGFGTMMSGITNAVSWLPGAVGETSAATLNTVNMVIGANLGYHFVVEDILPQVETALDPSMPFAQRYLAGLGAAGTLFGMAGPGTFGESGDVAYSDLPEAFAKSLIKETVSVGLQATGAIIGADIGSYLGGMSGGALGSMMGFGAEYSAQHYVQAGYINDYKQEIVLQAELQKTTGASISVDDPSLFQWAAGARAPTAEQIKSIASQAASPNSTALSDVLTQMATSNDSDDLQLLAQMANGEKITRGDNVDVETPESLRKAAAEALFEAKKGTLSDSQLAQLAEPGSSVEIDLGDGVTAKLRNDSIDNSKIADARADIIIRGDNGVDAAMDKIQELSDTSGGAKPSAADIALRDALVEKVVEQKGVSDPSVVETLLKSPNTDIQASAREAILDLQGNGGKVDASLVEAARDGIAQQVADKAAGEADAASRDPASVSQREVDLLKEQADKAQKNGQNGLAENLRLLAAERDLDAKQGALKSLQDNLDVSESGTNTSADLALEDQIRLALAEKDATQTQLLRDQLKEQLDKTVDAKTLANSQISAANSAAKLADLKAYDLSIQDLTTKQTALENLKAELGVTESGTQIPSDLAPKDHLRLAQAENDVAQAQLLHDQLQQQVEGKSDAETLAKSQSGADEAAAKLADLKANHPEVKDQNAPDERNILQINKLSSEAEMDRAQAALIEAQLAPKPTLLQSLFRMKADNVTTAEQAYKTASDLHQTDKTIADKAQIVKEKNDAITQTSRDPNTDKAAAKLTAERDLAQFELDAAKAKRNLLTAASPEEQGDAADALARRQQKVAAQKSLIDLAAKQEQTKSVVDRTAAINQRLKEINDEVNPESGPKAVTAEQQAEIKILKSQLLDIAQNRSPLSEGALQTAIEQAKAEVRKQATGGGSADASAQPVSAEEAIKSQADLISAIDLGKAVEDMVGKIVDGRVVAGRLGLINRQIQIANQEIIVADLALQETPDDSAVSAAQTKLDGLRNNLKDATRDLSEKTYDNGEKLVKGMQEQLDSLNTAIKEAEDAKRAEVKLDGTTTTLDHARDMATALKLSIDLGQKAVTKGIGLFGSGIRDFQNALTAGETFRSMTDKAAKMEEEASRLPKSKKSERIQQITNTYADMLRKEADLFAKRKLLGDDNPAVVKLNEEARALAKQYQERVENLYLKDYRDAATAAKTEMAKDKSGIPTDKYDPTSLAQNKDAILDELFGKTKGLSEAEAVAFAELTLKGVRGHWLYDYQLQMVLHNLQGNVVEVSMGGGKTLALAAVFGARNVMLGDGEEMHGHLVVADNKEISKYTDEGKEGKVYLSALGIKNIFDGDTSYNLNKTANDHYADLTRKLKESGSSVTLFSLDVYGHLARERKDSSNQDLINAWSKTNTIGVDEADVAAMLRKSYNVGTPKLAGNGAKEDAFDLFDRLTGVQKVDITDFKMKSSEPAYAVTRDGRAVFTDGVWKDVTDAFKGKYSANDIEEVFRAREDLDNKRVVMDKNGDVHKTDLGSGFQYQTKDQSDIYQLAVVYETARRQAEQSKTTFTKDQAVSMKINLTSHGSEATVSEAFSRLGGKETLVFGGSGTLDGAEAIARTVYGADKVVSVKPSSFYQFTTDASHGISHLTTLSMVDGKISGGETIEDFVARKAMESLDGTASGRSRGFLGIFDGKESLLDSLKQYFIAQIDATNPPNAEDLKAQIQAIYNQAKADALSGANMGRIGLKDDSDANARGGKSFMDAVKDGAASQVIQDIAKRVVVIDEYTLSGKMEDFAGKTGIHKDNADATAVFAVARAGRALNFAGEVNLVVVGAEKFDRADLLQILGRTGRSGANFDNTISETNKDGDRYATDRYILIDPNGIKSNLDYMDRVNNALGNDSGDLKSELKKYMDWMNDPDPYKQLEGNAGFLLMETRASATQFRLSSEVVTKLAKEPIGLLMANPANAQDAAIMQQALDNLRNGKYNSSRTTYTENDFRSPKEIAKETFLNGLRQAEGVWKDLAQNKSLSVSMRAEAAARWADIANTAIHVDSYFDGHPAESNLTFAKIDPTRSDISGDVAKVSAGLSRDLLPSETRTSVANEQVVMVEAGRLAQKAAAYGSDAVSDSELSGLAAMARKIVATNPNLQNDFVSHLAIVPQGDLQLLRDVMFPSQPTTAPQTVTSQNTWFGVLPGSWRSSLMVAPFSSAAQTYNALSSSYSLARSQGLGFFASVGTTIFRGFQGSLDPSGQIMLATQLLARNPGDAFALNALKSHGIVNQEAVLSSPALTPQAIAKTALAADNKEKTSMATALERRNQITQDLESVKQIALNAPQSKVEAGNGYSVVKTTRDGKTIYSLYIVPDRTGKISSEAILKAIMLSDFSAASGIEVNIQIPAGKGQEFEARAQAIRDIAAAANRGTEAVAPSAAAATQPVRKATVFVAEPGQDAHLIPPKPEADDTLQAPVAGKTTTNSHPMPAAPIGTGVRTLAAKVSSRFSEGTSGPILDLEKGIEAAATLQRFDGMPETDIPQELRSQIDAVRQGAVHQMNRLLDVAPQIYRALPALNLPREAKAAIETLIGELNDAAKARDVKAAQTAIVDYEKAVADPYFEAAAAKLQLPINPKVVTIDQAKVSPVANKPGEPGQLTTQIKANIRQIIQENSPARGLHVVSPPGLSSHRPGSPDACAQPVILVTPRGADEATLQFIHTSAKDVAGITVQTAAEHRDYQSQIQALRRNAIQHAADQVPAWLKPQPSFSQTNPQWKKQAAFAGIYVVAGAVAAFVAAPLLAIPAGAGLLMTGIGLPFMDPARSLAQSLYSRLKASPMASDDLESAAPAPESNISDLSSDSNIQELVPGSLEPPLSKPAAVRSSLRRIIGGGTVTLILGVIAAAGAKMLGAATLETAVAASPAASWIGGLIVVTASYLPYALLGVTVAILGWHFLYRMIIPRPESARVMPLGQILENA